MQKNTLIISLVFLVTGFASAYIILDKPVHNQAPANSDKKENIDETPLPANPFVTKNNGSNNEYRINNLEQELAFVKQQLLEIELQLQSLTQARHNNMPAPVISPAATLNRNQFSSALTQRLYNLETLIRGGLDPSRAEDIVRRKNSIELQRMALQDRATRENYLNSQAYFDELAVINQQDVTLRDELGDEGYDEYLYNSKQNNRIRISSVMLGSVAEQVGIQKNDIVLSYDNHRMFSWQELKDATTEGQLGDFVSLSIYRNGEIYSFSVPRGPLGIQLGSTRLAP